MVCTMVCLGLLCEKGPDAAAITYQFNHLPVSSVNHCDKRFQLQKRTFSFQNSSLPYDLPRRYCSSKPVPEDGHQFNQDAVNMEGFPGPGPGSAGFKMDFKQQSLANPCDKRFQLLQRTYSFQNPSLPYDLSRRYCSSKSVPEDDQQYNPDAISMDGFPGPGPGDSTEFVYKITVNAAELKKDLDLGVLEAEFNRDFRPILAAHCLMLPRTVDHQMTTAFLNGQAHGSSKREPLYLSSLDVMLGMKLLKEWEKKPLLDFIIQTRVHVADEWKETYGNIELLEYEFEESKSDFVRGECDASFKATVITHKAQGGATSGAVHQSSGQTVSGAKSAAGIAKLAIIIWRGRQLLWAEVFDGISCTDNHHAETLAALALLMKCEEEKYLNVKLWSDSRRVIGVINGSATIKINDPDCGTYLLLCSMPQKFTKLVAVLKPRELMFLPDQLLRLDGLPRAILDEALKLQSAYLRGCPLFSIKHNHRTSGIIKKFAHFLKKKESQNYNYTNDTIFFCKVRRGHKIDEFQRLRRALEPNSVEVVFDSSKSQPQELTGLMSGATMKSISETTMSFQAEVSTDRKQRSLVVVWDISVPKADYDRKDSCTIILAEDTELQEMKKRGISEINPSTYYHLNRVVFKYG
ncbi:unnamed protein product [Urochloa humidicola]